MINDFDFVQATNVQQALDVLATNKNVMALAGGTNVLVNMKRAPLDTECLLDLTHIDELKTISEGEGGIRIGAAVTFSELLDWKPGGITEELMQPMCRTFAGPLIRNLATVGGNICDASAAADLSPVLLALDAKIELQSASNGTRVLSLTEFFKGVRHTDRRKDELLTAITFNKPADDECSYYYKLGKRKADAISIVSIAIAARLNDDKIESIRIALGAVAPVALRATTAENILQGQKLSEELIQAAAEGAVQDSSPIDDFRCSADYRRQMVEALVKKGLESIRG